MKGRKTLLIDDKNIIINFDVVNKKWEEIKAFGLAYEAIEITLEECKKLNSEITIRLTDDKEMKILNKKWRNKDSSTNVLAFPNNKKLNISDHSKHIGDIIISFNTIKCEAIKRNISFIDHMIHIIIHGVLHLCGYDHIEKRDERTMISYEKIILNKIGIKDPYISYN
jgi:probable rRNA maturation factor